MALLEVRSLATYYGNIRALEDVSLVVEPGEVVTLIGANGAGKTTTLRTICGLLRPRSGQVLFRGERIDTVPPHKIVALGLSMSPEGRKIFARMTVRENLELGAFTRRDTQAVHEDLERVFTLFPRLKERLLQRGGTLSGGEQQMLAIGRALMARPSLLLLDEPSLGLAPLMVAQIFSIVREINASGTTVLLVEQNAHQALAVAHRAYVLETGRVTLSGPAQELALNPQVKAAYLGL